MTLSSDKTKWMVLREGTAYRTTQGLHDDQEIRYGNDKLEQVDIFKYLGLHFDAEASLSVMSAKRLEAAKRAAGAMTSMIARVGWRDKWLRLVLHNVFVRSVMMYGSVVWGSHLVDTRGEWWLDRTAKFGAQHRKQLRAILEYTQGCTERVSVHPNMQMALAHAYNKIYIQI